MVMEINTELTVGQVIQKVALYDYGNLPKTSSLSGPKGLEPGFKLVKILCISVEGVTCSVIDLEYSETQIKSGLFYCDYVHLTIFYGLGVLQCADRMADKKR